jgi:hypothetical protein
MHQNFVKIVSPITSKYFKGITSNQHNIIIDQVVKVVDLGPYLLTENLTLMKKKIAPSQLEKGVFNLFDKLNISHYLECYLSSSKLDCNFFIKL